MTTSGGRDRDRIRPIVVAFAALLGLAAAGPAVAHTLQAPQLVRVDRNGTFDFEAIFKIGPGDERISQYSVIGGDNVDDLDFDADGFCIELLPEGEEVSIPVAGHLIDEKRSGSALVHVETCGVSGSQTVFEVEIEIAPHRSGTIYWIESGSVRRAGLDGGSSVQVIDASDADATGSIAVDPVEGKIYWTAYEDFSGFVRRSGLFGQQLEGFLGGGKNGLRGLVVDLVERDLYRADPSDCVPLCGSIRRYRLDGSTTELVAVLNGPQALDVSPALSSLCWSDDWDEWIQCSDLEAASVQTVVEDTIADGIALDPILAKVFWVEAGNGRIRRANLDGAHLEDLITAGLEQPRDLAIDPLTRKIYWSDSGTGSIRRANLDGSGVEDVRTGLMGPTGIALLFGQGEIEVRFVGNLLTWSSVPGAERYDVARGSLATLRDTGGDFDAATTDCAATLGATEVDSGFDPETGNGFWWLVRAVTVTGKGTYDTGALSQLAPRDHGIDTSGEDCP